MKRLTVILICLMLASTPAQAYYCHAPVVAAPVSSSSPAGAGFIPVFGVLSLAALVMYFNAEGVDFPLCKEDAAKCEYTYPSDKNGQ